MTEAKSKITKPGRQNKLAKNAIYSKPINKFKASKKAIQNVARDKRTDKTIMDNFYNLVHSQAHVRLTAASSTFKILNAFKNNSNMSIFNDNLNYCIERLVAGLASSRAQARRGYGTLLLELLKRYPVSTERLFTVAQNKFIGQIGKDTSRDNLLGYFLLISIILESKNYEKNKSNAQYLDRIHRNLRHLHDTKSYFEFPVCKLLVDYHEQLYPHLLASIPPHAYASDSRLPAIDLLSILLCNKKEKIRVLNDLTDSEFLDLCSVLHDEKFLRRPLHPLFLELTNYSIQNRPKLFELFYKKFLSCTFFKVNHNELATMGLEYTSQALELVSDIDSVKTLLNDHVIKLLILSQRTSTALKKQAIKFFDVLAELFGNQIKGDKQYYILDTLTSVPGSISFDIDSKSSSIKNLLNRSDPSTLRRYLDKLMNKKMNKDGVHSSAKQIAFIIHRPQIAEDHETMKRVIKFLIENLTHPDESVRLSLFQAYHATLEQIVNITNPSHRVEMLSGVIDSYDEMNMDKSELWSEYKKLFNHHRQIIAKDRSGTKKLQPITTLFIFYGIQIIEHQLDCTSQMRELAQCTTEALDSETSNDNSWSDVITDQIIAILSATECKTWIRKLCEKVFRSLISYISLTSVELICDAIKAPLSVEGDDDSANEDSSCGDSDDDDDDDDDDDEEEGEEEEDEDELPSGNEAIKAVYSDSDVPMDDDSGQDQIISQGNGPPDDSDAEEYLDDEQMMKLDSVIADMFKLNRKKKADPSFKLRCLDLIKVLLQKSDDQDIINLILATILPLYTACRMSAEMRPISEKIITSLSKMNGKSKYPKLVDFLEKIKAKK